jgi:CheY-like chemotaxis protein/tetratricopeptide (TPR) repeat protein
MALPVALLIEDDPVTARVVGGWLDEAGWSTVHVDNGHDALRRLAELRPALVIADLVLPGVDGSALCAHIRMQPYGHRVPIVLISARSHARDAAIAAGADVFLPKPIGQEELLAAIAPHRPPDGDEPALPPAEPAFPTDTDSPPQASRPGTVRVPPARVFGEDAAVAPEEGALGPGVFLPLLRRLHAARFSGVLEAEGDGGLRAKLYFSRGAPAAARSSDEATGFGQVVRRLGIVSAEHLAASVDEGRRTGTPLGEVLLRSQLIDRRAVERALREQVLLRAAGIGRLPAGRYVLDPAEPLGMAGFDVHPAAIAWRLAADSPPGGEVVKADVPTGNADGYVRLDSAVVGMWALLDPEDQLGVGRALLVGGATAGDCVRIGGSAIAALLELLRDWDLLGLSDEPPPAAQREAGLAELDEGLLAATLVTEHRALLDANHYTVLGLQPDADADDVSAATVSALARFHPDTLPASLDATSRSRARAIYERALEAGRVLADPARRAIYDARIGGEALVPHGEIGMEDHAVLQAERARELFRRGENVTAAALFHMAILLEGEAADILAMLGWARHRACPEDTSAGEPELRRALVLDPDDEFALYYLGRLLAERGEIEEARRHLRAAVERNHEFDPAREALRELGG